MIFKVTYVCRLKDLELKKSLFTLKMLIESPDELRKWLTSHLEPL